MIENNFSVDADIKVSIVCLADSGSITNGSTKKKHQGNKVKKATKQKINNFEC